MDIAAASIFTKIKRINTGKIHPTMKISINNKSVKPNSSRPNMDERPSVPSPVRNLTMPTEKQIREPCLEKQIGENMPPHV
jgi:predicted HAD superfamily Cof-like phosphohydrolase